MDRVPQVYEDIPVVALRGLVVLPGELLHFDAGRDRSVNAIQRALEQDSMVFLSAQKDARKADIQCQDIYEVGTLCKLRQVLSLPGDSSRVFVEGVSRAVTVSLTDGEDYMVADIACIPDEAYAQAPAEALRRRVAKLLAEYAQLSNRMSADGVAGIEAKPDAGEYADAVANATMQKAADRQRILQEYDPLARLKLTLAGLAGEVEILKADKRIAKEVQAQVDKNQKEYYLREQIKAIRKELGDTQSAETDLMRDRLAAKQMPEEVRVKLVREIDRYADLPAGSHEQPAARSYIECMLDLPWSEQSEDTLDIPHARAVLEQDHYGLDKVKQRILEHLAVGRLTGKVNGQILCFVGPPGVGKTSISESIARALGRKFVRMSLGGIRDEAEIRGHRRTYIGAMPGRVIAAMRHAGTVNPVILFDEIDKLTGDYHGDPAAAMLEVLDSAQNFAFRDHFLEVPYDLSKALFITTANDKSAIPAPLLDRMEVIEVPSYLETEKAEIAKRHLIPKQLQKHGLSKGMLVLPDAMLPAVIRGYTSEAGVRELERAIGAICRKAACEIGEGKPRVRVSRARLVEYLGQPRHRDHAVQRGNTVGVVNGLAWTIAGGELLEVEAQAVAGSGQVQMTGRLGDVMQESVKAAYTFVRAHASELGIAEDAFKTMDVHLHVPQGAVPKDGPSAGITIATAIASALSGALVRADVAMTGEISLRGNVLPIGGLREKLLAALRAGLRAVIVPAENKQDMDDVPQEVKEALSITYVSDAMRALKAALVPLAAPAAPYRDAERSKEPVGAIYERMIMRKNARE
ncbi:MAG: endopeptidase La [Christensenellaceae bacterium]|nr:endopeptidase La [Christensenellaceae bacterium]